MGLPLLKEETVKKGNYKRYHIERPRDHLEKHEVYKLIEGAKSNKNGIYSKNKYKIIRNQLMLLIAFQHGLRNSETRLLKWDQVDLETNRLSVIRLKNGLNGMHPLWGNDGGGKNGKRAYNEVAMFKKLKSETDKRGIISPYVFVDFQGRPMTRDNFYKIVRKLGEEVGMSIIPHPHMFRHGEGAHAINNGKDIRHIQEYLGHVNIENTVRYTRLDTNKFNGFH